MGTKWLRYLLLGSLAFLEAACSEDDPNITEGDIVNEAIVGSTCNPTPSYTEVVTSCMPLSTDYQPRTGETDAGDWPNCISDGNTYLRIQESISTIARVEAGDFVAGLLWDAGATPTGEDFLTARVTYEEEQGLGSRVARRYDVHYDAPATGRCDEEGVADANPDYCVGPATLRPIIVDAFADGATGNNRIVNAARIQAALHWFFYVSSLKEAFTCTETAKDCDSAWAYYTGGTDRDTPAGLAADIDALAPETHDRAYDAALAVRCWRGLENNDAGEASAFLDRRDLAIEQYDRALLRGMAILIRQRFAELSCATGDYQEAALQYLRIVVPLFDLETRSRNAGLADLMLTEISKSADAIDAQNVINGLDTTYACP